VSISRLIRISGTAGWTGKTTRPENVIAIGLEHAPGAVREYLSGREPGTAVAVEATGNWYWIIDEIEQAGLQPRLVHPRKAKLMMGLTNKDGHSWMRKG